LYRPLSRAVFSISFPIIGMSYRRLSEAFLLIGIIAIAGAGIISTVSARNPKAGSVEDLQEQKMVRLLELDMVRSNEPELRRVKDEAIATYDANTVLIEQFRKEVLDLDIQILEIVDPAEGRKMKREQANSEELAFL